MSPDNLKHFDPSMAPFLFGMVVKVKDFVALKALTIAVTIAFSVGIFYSQTNAMMDKQDEYTVKVDKLTDIVIMLQRSQDITANNVGHIRNDMDKLTVQLKQMQSNIAKIRRM